MFYSIASFIVRTLLQLITRLEVTGVENVPLEGPVLIVANHLHFADPPILGAVLPRKVIFMAKSDLFSRFPLGLMVQAYEAFSVRRGQGDTRAIRQSLKILGSGKALGIFPEGHRSDDGLLQPAHVGAAMVALRANPLIVPVGISGTRTFLRWPNFLQRPRVVVAVGKPFRAEVDATQSLRQQQNQLTNEIMRRIADLVPAEQRGAYGALGPDGRPVEVATINTARRTARLVAKTRRMPS